VITARNLDYDYMFFVSVYLPIQIYVVVVFVKSIDIAIQNCSPISLYIQTWGEGMTEVASLSPLYSTHTQITFTFNLKIAHPINQSTMFTPLE
jgi:hypothetical protein